jgi:hypothetical protein
MKFLGYSILGGRISCPQTFVSTASTVWEIQRWIGGVDLRGRAGFSSVRKARTVRELVADSPRCVCSSRVLHVFAHRCLRSVVALSFRWGRFQTARNSGADSPRVPGGQSACSPRTVRYSGLSLEVLFAFSDSPRCRPGRSVVWVWIVRGSRPDGPRGPCGRSAPPSRTVRQSLSALFFGSISSSFRASACASRNRS